MRIWVIGTKIEGARHGNDKLQDALRESERNGPKVLSLL
jgi:hypothetical protein